MIRINTGFLNLGLIIDFLFFFSFSQNFVFSLFYCGRIIFDKHATFLFRILIKGCVNINRKDNWSTFLIFFIGPTRPNMDGVSQFTWQQWVWQKMFTWRNIKSWLKKVMKLVDKLFRNSYQFRRIFIEFLVFLKHCLPFLLISSVFDNQSTSSKGRQNSKLVKSKQHTTWF